jgi:hypothetical protein
MNNVMWNNEGKVTSQCKRFIYTGCWPECRRPSWLTPTSLKPWKKKLDAILKRSAPTNVTQTHSFLGAVNIGTCGHTILTAILTPLTKFKGKGKFVCVLQHQATFDQMKALIASEAILNYLDHNIPFEYTLMLVITSSVPLFCRMVSLLHTTHVSLTLRRTTTLQ